MTPAQGNLFEATPPARASSPTQQAAAQAVAPAVGRQCLRLLRALGRLQRGTREQLCAATSIRESAACGRLNWLADPNRARPAFKPRLSPFIRTDGKLRASSGLFVTAYVLTDAGRACLRR